MPLLTLLILIIYTVMLLTFLHFEIGKEQGGIEREIWRVYFSFFPPLVLPPLFTFAPAFSDPPARARTRTCLDLRPLLATVRFIARCNWRARQRSDLSVSLNVNTLCLLLIVVNSSRGVLRSSNFVRLSSKPELLSHVFTSFAREVIAAVSGWRKRQIIAATSLSRRKVIPRTAVQPRPAFNSSAAVNDVCFSILFLRYFL